MRALNLFWSIIIGLVVFVILHALSGIIDFYAFATFLNMGLEIDIERWQIHPAYLLYIGIKEFSVLFAAGFFAIVVFNNDLALRGILTAIACGIFGFFMTRINSIMLELIMAIYYMVSSLTGSAIAIQFKGRRNYEASRPPGRTSDTN